MKNQILLLDLDGTLVDTERDLAASVNHALRAMGHAERTLAEVRSFVGQGATTLLARALSSADPADLDRARALFFEHYAAHLLDESRLYPGWENVFAADIDLVVATNKPERFALQIVEGLGLSRRFKLVVGGDTLAVNKPDPGVAEHIARALGVSLSRFVMVGDGLPDAGLAKAAGFPFWAARWGYGGKELDEYAARRLEAPEEILQFCGGG